MYNCFQFKTGLIFKTPQKVEFEHGWKVRAKSEEINTPLNGHIHSQETGKLISYVNDVKFSLNEVCLQWTEK